MCDFNSNEIQQFINTKCSLARSKGYNLPFINFYIYESEESNAFYNYKDILITTKMLQIYKNNLIESVICHELGHALQVMIIGKDVYQPKYNYENLIYTKNMELLADELAITVFEGSIEDAINDKRHHTNEDIFFYDERTNTHPNPHNRINRLQYLAFQEQYAILNPEVKLIP